MAHKVSNHRESDELASSGISSQPKKEEEATNFSQVFKQKISWLSSCNSEIEEEPQRGDR